MRTNITQMDFRTVPSTIPLHSPSPDNHGSSCLTPTLTPNALQLKRNLTPIKKMYNNSKISANYNTSAKQNKNETTIKTYQHLLHEKDELIDNLKNMINMITENKRYRKQPQTERQNEIKVLTIQNQKLVQIIDKITSQNAKLKQITQTYNQNKNISLNNNNNTLTIQDQQITVKFQNYQKQIQQLTQTLKIKQQTHENETNSLKKQNRNLQIQINSYELDRKQLESENSRLMRILKQKNQCSSRIHNLISSGVSSDQASQQTSKNNQKSNQRLSLLKIKQQYNENIKELRQQLTKQVQQFYDLIKMNYQSIDIKVTGMSKRLPSLQNIIYNKYKNDPIIQSKTKSQIYIQQAPDSSSSRGNYQKQQASRALDTQHKTKNQMQQQITTLKTQLQQIRFKYDKLCMDTDTIAYSKRNFPSTRQQNQYEQLQLKYSASYQQLQKKDKQISILYEQIKQIEIEKQQILQQLCKFKQMYADKQKSIENYMEQLEAYRKEILSIKSKSSQELEVVREQTQQYIRNQTENKVKMLMTNYEKQLQILNKQILTKHNKIQQLTNRIQQMEQKYTMSIQQNNIKQQHLNRLQQEYNKQQQYHNRQQKQYRIMQQSLNKQITQNIQQINRINRQNNQLKVQLDTNRDQLQQEIEQLQSKISQLSGQLIEMQKNYQYKINQVEQSNRLLNNKIMDMVDKYRNLPFQKIRQIVNTITNKQQQYQKQQQKQSMIEQYKKQIQQKTVKIIYLQCQLETSQKLSKYYQKQIQNQQVINRKLSNQHKRLQQKYKQLQDRSSKGAQFILNEIDHMQIIYNQYSKITNINNSNNMIQLVQSIHSQNIHEIQNQQRQQQHSEIQNSIIDKLGNQGSKSEQFSESILDQQVMMNKSQKIENNE